MSKVTPELLARAIAGEREAVRDLLAILQPILQRRIGRVLLRRGAAQHVDVREEMLDLMQQVYVSLLEKDGHLVRSWDPARGMSFENFVGLIAEQTALAILRTRGGRPWHEELLDPSAEICSGTPERIAESKEAVEIIFDKLRAELSGRGLRIFDLLVVEERSIEEVCVTMNMTESAVYAWRSRLGRRMEQIAREVL